MAVIPWAPHRAKAFRSAWIPAPPPESEPAMDNSRGGGWASKVTAAPGRDHRG